MSDTERVTYWCPWGSTRDAINEAESKARADGWRVLTVCRVALEPHIEGRGWRVTLAVRRVA